MRRFNPLTRSLNAPSEPAKKARKKAASKKPAAAPTSTELSRKVLTLPVAMFRAMSGTDGTKARSDFAAWCATRPGHEEWRAAWRIFEAEAAPNSSQPAVKILLPPAPTLSIPAPESNIINLSDQRQTAVERALAVFKNL